MQYIKCDKLIWAGLFLLIFPFLGYSQSFELMPGDKRIFADIQWLKPLDKQYKWTLFSRTRATVDYDNNTNLFSGVYLNHTTKSGFGGSIIGKIGANSGGVDAGVHLFKSKPNWMLFAVVSAGVKSELEYSWFSIFRFTPPLNEKWKLYTSLELFTLFNRGNHLISVQRMRLGLSRKSVQFGLANNLSEASNDLIANNNFGVFIKKTF